MALKFSCSDGKQRCYYAFESLAPFEEDATHEFKGHRNLTREEMPMFTQLPGTDRSSRQPLSKTLNAFLNSGIGGTIYVGIPDNGRICGIPLTQYRKDHFKVALDKLRERYNPPVEGHRFRLTFVPVISPNCTEEEIDATLIYDPSKHVSDESRSQPHTMWSPQYCWCDKDHVAQHNMGVSSMSYVIEIRVTPWDPADPRNENAVGDMKAQPIYEDEEGCVHFRNQASINMYNRGEMAQLSRQKVLEHYQPQIDRLKKIRDELVREQMKKREAAAVS